MASSGLDPACRDPPSTLVPPPLWQRFLEATLRAQMVAAVAPYGGGSASPQSESKLQCSSTKRLAASTVALMRKAIQHVARCGCIAVGPEGCNGSALENYPVANEEEVLSAMSATTRFAAALSPWWECLVAAAATNDGFIYQEQYVTVMTRILEALTLFESSKEIEEVVRSDWRRDAMGRPRMKRSVFLTTLVAVSCVWFPRSRGSWFDSAAVAHHAAFLGALFVVVFSGALESEDGSASSIQHVPLVRGCVTVALPKKQLSNSRRWSASQSQHQSVLSNVVSLIPTASRLGGAGELLSPIVCLERSPKRSPRSKLKPPLDTRCSRRAATSHSLVRPQEASAGSLEAWSSNGMPYRCPSQAASRIYWSEHNSGLLRSCQQRRPPSTDLEWEQIVERRTSPRKTKSQSKMKALMERASADTSAGSKDGAPLQQQVDEFFAALERLRGRCECVLSVTCPVPSVAGDRCAQDFLVGRDLTLDEIRRVMKVTPSDDLRLRRDTRIQDNIVDTSDLHSALYRLCGGEVALVERTSNCAAPRPKTTDLPVGEGTSASIRSVIQRRFALSRKCTKVVVRGYFSPPNNDAP